MNVQRQQHGRRAGAFVFHFKPDAKMKRGVKGLALLRQRGGHVSGS